MGSSQRQMHTRDFRNFLRSAGVTPFRLPARSPNLDAYAERFVLGRIVEGANFMRAMRPLLQSIAAEIGAEMPLEGVFKEGRRVVTVSVDTEPRTLRPRRSRCEMLVDVVANDGKRERRHDVRELAWDWTKATGCGAR